MFSNPEDSGSDKDCYPVTYRLHIGKIKGREFIDAAF